MRIYEAAPEGTARGGVIVIQEAFGVNEHIEDVTDRFAAAGYHAVSPALYHRQGDPTFEYGQFDKLIEVMGALSDDTILEDLDGRASDCTSAASPIPTSAPWASAWAGERRSYSR